MTASARRAEGQRDLGSLAVAETWPAALDRTRTRGAPRSPRPFKPPGRVSAIVAGRSDQPRTEPFQAAFS